MQHIHRICKHCHREYTYCTYGNGPEYGTEEGCSMTYCAECQKAIDEALAKIPVRFVQRFMEIKEPRLLPLFDKIKKRVDEQTETAKFPRIQPVLPDSGNYDIIEMYYHKGKTYLVEWNEDTPNDKHISVRMMYDTQKKEFTNSYWPNDDSTPPQTYYRQRSWVKEVKEMMGTYAEPLPVKPMAEPIGKLQYMEYMGGKNNITFWDIKTSHKAEYYKQRPKEHILRTHELMNDGIHLKGYIKYNNNVVLDVDIDPNDLIDFVDYKYTIEKYDDEDVNHITKIECY